VQANTSGKHRWSVDPGLATIVAASIAALVAVAGGVIGRVTAPGATSGSTISKVTQGTPSATITAPTTGKVPFASTLSGRVVNLQRGELVWTFFQMVNGNGSLGSQTYPTSGPCNINFTSNTWTCRDAYIGKISDHWHVSRLCSHT
jgi:hypothetical protein